MANNNPEEDQDFGPFPYLGPDEDQDETQPAQAAGQRTNPPSPSSAVRPPANVGQGPANGGQLLRFFLNRNLGHLNPRGRGILSQAYFNRLNRASGPHQTLSQPSPRRSSVLEEHPLSLGSAKPYVEDSGFGYSHPPTSPFPTAPLQLRPPPPLPPRRTLPNPTPAVVEQSQVSQRPYLPTGEASLSANVQSLPSADSDATLLVPGSEASPSEAPPNEAFDSEDPESSGTESSTSEESSSEDSAEDDPPDQDSPDQGAPRQAAPDQGGPDEGGPREGASGEDSPRATSPTNHYSDGPFRTESSEMPYNNAAIPPPEEISGQASLPLARVKKILQIDEDTVKVSNNAAFVITIATEMFIRHLAEQAMNIAKLEKKPRRNIQYKDLANAVARIDNLQFLEDVIPRTTTYREYKAKRASKAATQAPQTLQNGQTTLDGSRTLPQRPVPRAEPHGASMDDGNMSDGTIDELPAVQNRQEPARVNGNSGLVFEHYEPNGTTRRDESGDIEMR